MTDELDCVGPVASAVLARHGLLWPPNAHFHAPLFERGARRLVPDRDRRRRAARLVAVVPRAPRARAARSCPRPRDAFAVAFALAPPRLRAARDAPAHARSLPVAPRARRRAAGTEACRRRGCRAVRLARRHPLQRQPPLPGCRHAKPRRPGRSRGCGARPPLPRARASSRRSRRCRARRDSTAVVERWTRSSATCSPRMCAPAATKASFDGAFWHEHSRELVARWAGEGVDPTLVDVERLRARVGERSARPAHVHAAAVREARARLASVSRRERSSSRLPASSKRSQPRGRRNSQPGSAASSSSRSGRAGGTRSPRCCARRGRRSPARTGSTATSSPHARNTQPRNRSLGRYLVELHPPALAEPDAPAVVAQPEPLRRLRAQIEDPRADETVLAVEHEHVVADDRMPARGQPGERRALPALSLRQHAPDVRPDRECSGVEALAAEPAGRDGRDRRQPRMGELVRRHRLGRQELARASIRSRKSIPPERSVISARSSPSLSPTRSTLPVVFTISNRGQSGRAEIRSDATASTPSRARPYAPSGAGSLDTIGQL